MTDAEFSQWLIDPSNDNYRVTLFEIHHASGVVRLATHEYNKTKPFGAFIIDTPNFATRIDAPVSVGSLKAVDVLRENWTNKYFGDVRWNLSQFKKTATLINESVNFENDYIYTFNFSDAGRLLNVPVQSETHDDSGERKLMPMGDCKLIKPQITDAFTLTYWYGLNCTLTKLYDIGLDITANIDIDTPSVGYFQFKSGHNPAGELRFDCTSNNTVQEIAQKIADDHNIQIGFKNFGSNQTKPVGVLASNYTTIKDLFAVLARSSESLFRITSDNKVEFIVPSQTNAVRITDDEIIGDLSKSGEIAAKKRVIVKYGKNIHPYYESAVSPDRTVLPQNEVDKLTRKEKSITENTGANTGTLDEEIVIDTVLSNDADAQSLANRLKLKYAQKRILYSAEIKVLHNTFKVADAVNFSERNIIGYLTAVDENSISNTAKCEVQRV